MKQHFIPFSVLALMALPTTQAANIISEVYDFSNLNASIPDGNPSGLASFEAVTGSAISTIQEVKVSLNITGTFNGDLYAYLQHDTGLSILLNRSGRAAGSPFGYDDDGFTITLLDSTANNIHNYQDSLAVSPGSPVTGEWQPDGRLVDPSSVLDTDPQTAPLSVFNGMDPNGGWTLFLADLSGGESSTLNGWSLELTGELIPEPSVSSFAIFAMAGMLMTRRRQSK